MFRISNTLVGILHILPLLLGLAAMGGSAYIRVHGDCQKVLQYPLLFGGLFIFVISTLGLVGTLCRVNAALYLYLLATFFVIAAFTLFTVVALFVTRNNARDHVASSVGYRAGDFSPWLQHYVTDDRNWDEAKSCFVQARVCRNLAVDGNNDSLVFKRLSTTQFGCCKPPVQCGFTMKNATFWEVPKRDPAVNDSDCRTWNNRQEKLCYDCDSCKGGVLANIRNQWRHLTIFNVCVLVLVTTIYVLGCYAIRNNRLESSYKYQRRIGIPLTVI
ncbi:Tetraspanin-11 protein [Spatholobus suberectus]|nr:Tetraspanin-11 protein [Spatholobus suberectus]TKY73254.1 Tetraspanin-11 protein [Spatholobus suberectus]